MSNTPLTFSTIATSRLRSQQLAGTNFQTPKELVAYMGAMQAQDYNMVKWAVGVRLPSSTDSLIEAALGAGEILRTHLLRPTWHLVVAEDIYWMLELTAPRLKTAMRSRHNQLELTEPLVTKSKSIIEKALAGGQHLTRAELVAELENAGIPMNSERAGHLLYLAELDALICNGSPRDKKQTYALLSERVKKPNPLSKEEALAKLAHRYFTSHGPATLSDFVWWSGLSIGNARTALQLVASNFHSETINDQTYWFPDSLMAAETIKESVYLLPAFDEFLISYRDRAASLLVQHQTKAVSKNGIFWPIIVVNGQVVGTWKRTVKKSEVVVETNFFELPSKAVLLQIEQAAERFGVFLDKKVSWEAID